MSVSSNEKCALQASRRTEHWRKDAGRNRAQALYTAAAKAERKRFREAFKNCREVVFAAKRVLWEMRHKV
jgi:hypothetical protein